MNIKKLFSGFLASVMILVSFVKADSVRGAEKDSFPEKTKQGFRTVGYLPDWSYKAYKKLDFTAITHMNIAFCNPDQNGKLFCYIPDSEMKNIVDIAHDSDVKVMAALGGAGGCDSYNALIDTPEEMAQFNNNIIDYCRTYNLDGIDLDIELGSGHEIWNYYADWVSSLRSLCDEYGYELSTATANWVAVNVSPETFGLFDFINVMAYDNDMDKVSHADMEFAESSLAYFNEKKKVPKENIVLGVPFYGRGYTADGALDWNSYMPFSELISIDSSNYDADEYNGIAYNGASTMRKKCTLAKEYGGIMIWELSQDAEGKHSLLALIKEEMNPSVVMGDVNSDGAFDTSDVILLQRYLLGISDSELKNHDAADFSGDGIINVLDFCMMKAGVLA